VFGHRTFLDQFAIAHHHHRSAGLSCDFPSTPGGAEQCCRHCLHVGILQSGDGLLAHG